MCVYASVCHGMEVRAQLVGAGSLAAQVLGLKLACQAMSRVWRDGQKHPVHIYRLLTTGKKPSPDKKTLSP